ncbi:MAG: glycine--tRNA ligase subunit beta [Acidobacteria bacterium]|nr:glycine--tRNA ligase subunit beta [Acidobacteriota bacterium]
MSGATKKELLLEVRSEEIPARMLEPAVKAVASRLFEDLTTRGIGPTEVETGYTPRRLVFVLRGMPEKEPDRQEQVLGPPARVAFDGDGNPTKALEGFAARCGLPVSAMKKIDTAKGEYVGAVLETRGRTTAEVLTEIVPRILAEVHWAKNMKWGQGEGPWVRPVHGLLALYGGQALAMKLFDVEACGTTTGHPVLSPQAFEVKDAADYRAKLLERGIEIRAAERRRILLEGMKAAARGAGGRLVEDGELLHKLAAICAIPGVLEGRFDPSFLELPREVLITSLKDHQSAFTVEAEDGTLLPLFLTVMDRPDDPEGHVRSGNEWVVAARLEDARFFYQEDRKHTLEDRLEELRNRTFHVRLGSYFDKSDRLASLAETLCRQLGREDLAEPAARAARLLKADLSTQMVGEFASLQGIMGGVYAAEQGHPEEVWQAIYDQYLPASVDDPLPRGEVGPIVAVADRLDTLVGIFGLGLIPSGSKDPFGLRRAAQGVVRILLEQGLRLDLEAATAAARQLYGDRLEVSPEALWTSLAPFFLDRVEHLLGRANFAYDEIAAAVAAGTSDLPDLLARTRAVHEIREDPSFLSVVLSAKRIANIVKGQAGGSLDPGLLEEGAETALHGAAEELASEVRSAHGRGDYLAALKAVAELAPSLDRYFEDVMVMVEDETLRANRIALLRGIEALITPTAHLTELVVDKAEHR